jgi:hypothetical protein
VKEVFGGHTRQVLDFLARLRDLSPAEIDLVTNAWKQASDLDRAEARARLHNVTTQEERHPILAAASAARRAAMETTRTLRRPDWAFWAAAWDAAAAIAAAGRLANAYDSLTAPLALLVPSQTAGQAEPQGDARAGAVVAGPDASEVARCLALLHCQPGNKITGTQRRATGAQRCADPRSHIT